MFQATPTTTADEAANASRREGRLPRAWRAAHEPAAGVPRWARRVAYAVPLVVLPSGIWRLGVLFTADKRGGSIEDWAMNGYVVLLTLISEVLAFTTVGLVAHWDEVFPPAAARVVAWAEAIGRPNRAQRDRVEVPDAYGLAGRTRAVRPLAHAAEVVRPASSPGLRCLRASARLCAHGRRHQRLYPVHHRDGGDPGASHGPRTVPGHGPPRCWATRATAPERHGLAATPRHRDPLRQDSRVLPGSCHPRLAPDVGVTH